MEVEVMWIMRVMFGVSASPFLLNATINHHMRKFAAVEREFVDKFLRSFYVDDFTAGSHNVESAYQFYIKSKLHPLEVSFNLRKFATNSPELQGMITANKGQ